MSTATDRIATALREFVYGTLRKSRHTWSAATLDDFAGGLPDVRIARTSAPLRLAEQLLVMDRAALLEFAYLEKLAVLEVGAVAPSLSDAASPSCLPLLQDALRHTRHVVLFAIRPELAVEGFSPSALSWLPYPAAPYLASRQSQPGVVVVVHGSDAIVDPDTLVEAARRRLPGVPMQVVRLGDEAAGRTADTALDFKVHVHLGDTRDAGPGWRVIDSLAARRCVIHSHMTAGDAHAGDVSISHLRSGISTQTMEQTQDALDRVLRDAATVEVFARHGTTQAEDFNRRIEAQLLDVLQ